MPGKPIEIDSESGAQIYLVAADNRPTDNIYGEQPYGDTTGRWIAVRHFPKSDQQGGISIIDLRDGLRRDVLVGDPGFPAFHAWSEYLYYKETIDEKLILRRCRYDTPATEDIAHLPSEKGAFSYGTISPDHHYYAVSIMENKGEPAKLHLLCLQTGQWDLLLDKPGYHAKHEQFSRDGENNVLIQLNHQPDIKEMRLGNLTIDGRERLFPADRPFTPRPSGHEAWIGTSDRILFSTASDPESIGNIWSGRIGETRPTLVFAGEQRFIHVSVSRCGRYWIGDTVDEGMPIYIGIFGSGTCRRLVFSRTVWDGKQWSHSHPYLTADNKWLIFNSNRNGHAQVYGAKLPLGWLDES